MRDAKGHGSDSVTGPAHMSGIERIAAKMKDFAHSESGEGHLPAAAHTLLEEAMKEPSVWIHAGHFLAVMATLMLIPLGYEAAMYFWS